MNPDGHRTRESETRFTGVRIRSANIDADTIVYAAATGVSPIANGDTRTFALADAHVTLTSEASGHNAAARGIDRLLLDVADTAEIDRAAQRLERIGAPFVRTGDQLEMARTVTGVPVSLRTLVPPSGPSPHAPPDRSAGGTAGSYLDHVAVLVADVPAVAQRWEALLGHPPAHIGVHPLGTAFAARFLIGTRMIELLAPLAHGDSPLHARLARVGDAPYGLAIIARDLAATITRLTAAGARIIEQAPHLIVHPNDASGIPIQLTPRVDH